MTRPPVLTATIAKVSMPGTCRSCRRMFLLLGVAVGTAACTTPYEGRYDFYDGWRKGRVIEVGAAPGIGRSSPRDCRKDGTLRAADTRYAYVRYRGVSRLTSQIVPLSADSSLKAGDLVYLKAGDCNAPVPMRAAQGDAW